MGIVVVRGDACALPLPDASVDLIVTSPPYYALRSYTDGGEHYAGQIGSEATPAAYIAALVECTREWARVLKPGGSMFVDLGDKYAQDTERSRNGEGARQTTQSGGLTGAKSYLGGTVQLPRRDNGVPRKSLMLLPERYRIACVDQLGLIARAVLVWSKPNGLPESVTDRVRRSHEDWVHLVKQPRYFAAVDEIREPQAGEFLSNGVRNPRFKGGGLMPGEAAGRNSSHLPADRAVNRRDDWVPSVNPLGKLPGSVWTVATEPLKVPDRLAVDHFAAFPTEWPRRLILGWSPSGICTACGEGRRPVVASHPIPSPKHGPNSTAIMGSRRSTGDIRGWDGLPRFDMARELTGYACACTPYTDHPERRLGSYHDHQDDGTRGNRIPTDRKTAVAPPTRDYHFDRWTPAPTRPAVVLDPFGGTGTTAHVAAALGRTGVTVDASADYCRLAAAPELRHARRRKVLGLSKPTLEPVPDGQLDLLALTSDRTETERLDPTPPLTSADGRIRPQQHLLAGTGTDGALTCGDVG